MEVRSQEAAGEPVPVAEQVGSNTYGTGFFSASDNGVLIYRTGSSADRQFTWFDRHGNVVGSAGEPGHYGTLKLSPDGTRAAFAWTDPLTNNTDIWLIDLLRGTQTRFTSDAAEDAQPVW